jgi:NAD(P)-dependent dehydrogenase (short-subunit alcohol dehydrogenase family)
MLHCCKILANLTGKVALVTGASRGVGKGIALGLGEAKCTVYITARETGQGAPDVGGNLDETAKEVEGLGGTCIPVRCDHRYDNQVESLFRQIGRNQGRLDILVNNVWAGYENMSEGGVFTWNKPFWEQPLWRWDAMFQTGVRSHFVASRLAASMMIQQEKGLIVNISFWAAQRHIANTIYGASKAATDKLTRDMAEELRPYNVTVVSLYPDLVRTERVMQAHAYLDLRNSESPQFIGRCVAALASDPNVIRKSGQVAVAATLAREYGFTDLDGSQPAPLTF